MGDWNTNAGNDDQLAWQNTIGRFSNESTNERGERLLKFADKYKLLLANTLFNHTKSRISTWHSPNGLTHNQIDYILTPQYFKSRIIRISTRTYSGVDIHSDHDLVLCNINLKLSIKKIMQGNRIRFDLEKLNKQQFSHIEISYKPN